MLDSEFAVLDAPRMSRPKRIDPDSGRLQRPLAWYNIRSADSPDYEWFERIAVAHMNYVFAIPVLTLTEPNSPLIDVVADDDRFAVAQVKSGKQIVSIPMLAEAMGGAGMKRSLFRRHVFYYSESGYTQGAFRFADENLLFLWTIDKRGFVRPHSPAAQRLTAIDYQRMQRPKEGLKSLEQLVREANWNRVSPDFERRLTLHLDRCAMDEAEERENARLLLVDAIRAKWLSRGLNPSGMRDRWDYWLLQALEQAEIQGIGGKAAVEILGLCSEVIDQCDASQLDSFNTGMPLWSDIPQHLSRRFAAKRFQRLAIESYIVGTGEALPEPFLSVFESAWTPGAKWVAPEKAYRDCLLQWDRNRGDDLSRVPDLLDAIASLAEAGSSDCAYGDPTFCERGLVACVCGIGT